MALKVLHQQLYVCSCGVSCYVLMLLVLGLGDEWKGASGGKLSSQKLPDFARTLKLLTTAVTSIHSLKHENSRRWAPLAPMGLTPDLGMRSGGM